MSAETAVKFKQFIMNVGYVTANSDKRLCYIVLLFIL